MGKSITEVLITTSSFGIFLTLTSVNLFEEEQEDIEEVKYHMVVMKLYE